MEHGPTELHSGLVQDSTSPGLGKAQRGSKCHYGCIVALQRSSFLPNLILSAGGWDWALWRDDFLAAPLQRGPAAPAEYSCATWSTTRPGIHLYS